MIGGLLALLGLIAACFLAAMTGAFFRPGEWYERLKKPSWRPPNRLFAPVWTVLYVMIAVSGWLVWREAGLVVAALPLAVYALQLVLNAAWLPDRGHGRGPSGHRYRYAGLAPRLCNGRFDVGSLHPGEWIVEPGLIYVADDGVSSSQGK